MTSEKLRLTAEAVTYLGKPVQAICWVDATSADILLKDGGIIENTYIGSMSAVRQQTSDGDGRGVENVSTWASVGGCREVKAAKEKRRVRPHVNHLPEDDAKRAQYPMADGLIDYFPNALAEVSRVSFIGSQKHNKGAPMHWARGKSTDHRNKIARHLVDAGGVDEVVMEDGTVERVRHSAFLAWRALANLQEELEREEGYRPSRASRF